MNGDLLTISINVAYGLLSASLVLVTARLLRGPSMLDRVAALDLMAYMVVGLAAVTAIDTGERSFIDVALAVALVAFVSSVVYARFIEQEGRRD